LNPKKEVDDMKRMIFSGCIILVLALMVFVSYAEMQKIAMSEGYLLVLKGKWTGTRSLNLGTNLKTDLEIFSDRFPLNGKLIFYNERKQGQTTQTHALIGGEINNKGNLLFGAGVFKVELSLYKDGEKMTLMGKYFTSERSGTISLKKK